MTHWSLPAFSSSLPSSLLVAPNPNPARTPPKVKPLFFFTIVALLVLSCIDRGGVQRSSAARALEGVRGGDGGRSLCEVGGWRG